MVRQSSSSLLCENVHQDSQVLEVVERQEGAVNGGDDGAEMAVGTEANRHNDVGDDRVPRSQKFRAFLFSLLPSKLFQWTVTLQWRN